MSDWISVKDRMPPKAARFQEYIVYVGKAVTVAWLDSDNGEWLWVTDPERVFDGEVTHWMPLPEPPPEPEQSDE